MRYIVSILVVSLLLVGFTAGTALAQAEATEDAEVGAGAGLTPDSPFYFLDDLWDSIRLTLTFNAERKAERRLEFAQEKLAEAEIMAQEKKEKALEKALSRYEENIERAQKWVEQFEDERKDRVAELVAKATSRHFEVLERVREKVPEQAKEALLKAREASEKGHLESIRALSERRPEKAAEFTAKALEQRVKLAEKLANRQDKEAEREVKRFERFAEFAEELRSKFQDNTELRERIRVRLEDGMTQREATLRRVMEQVPDNAKEAVLRALEQSRRIEKPGSLEEIRVRIEERRQKRDKVCIQVITPARNPATSEVRDFPTPCDVPDDWEIISQSGTRTDLREREGIESFFERPQVLERIRDLDLREEESVQKRLEIRSSEERLEIKETTQVGE